MKPLTKSQQKIYDFLKDRSQYGIPPSVREICAATGLKSTSTVHAHLKSFRKFRLYLTRCRAKQGHSYRRLRTNSTSAYFR